ncbi:MAG: amidohydrolase [Actinomycetota bacterium]
MSELDAMLDEFLARHLAELVAFRRHLHAHPERSYEEHETTALVAQRLQVAGLTPRPLSVGTGLVCDVPGPDGPRPRVALRADLDALAMTDEKGVAYRSQHPGIAHACGHDVHTTIVLGCGLALARLLADTPRGGVRLVFQPAEETVPGGALDVIADGGIDDVDAIFGLHCDPKLDVGRFGVRVGPITAAADLVEIRLHGPGGHTARPALTVDLVETAGAVATSLPTRLRAREPALSLVFGSVHAGDAANVIPAFAVLRGSVRTPDRRAWGAAPALLEEELIQVLADSGATHEIVYAQGPPPVDNEPAATAVLAGAARAALGSDAVCDTPQSDGGDDFAWYLERVRGSYGRLGVRTPGSTDPPLDLHASTFDVDERAIGTGIRVLVRAALGALDALA